MSPGGAMEIYIRRLAFVLITVSIAARGQFKPDIPKVWDKEALDAMTLPVIGLSTPIKYAPSDWYYRIPERQIYHGYPVYKPGMEPPNYMNWVAAQEPELAFDAAKLSSEFDWLQAGEAVFQSGANYNLLTPDDIHDPDLWDKFQFAVDAEGSLPGWRYVIRKKGKVELASTLCGSCHERAMDGRTVVGAPSSALVNAVPSFAMRRSLRAAKDWDAAARQLVARQFALFSVPWLKPNPAETLSKITAPQILSAYEALPKGVAARPGTSAFFPPRIPDLIGVKDRKYLGATGLHRHLGIGDLMRYAVLETGMDEYSQYGDFRPAGALPDPSTLERLSDAQLYALALYIYSLKPPPNPNRLEKNKMAKAGQKIFEREGCSSCHPPPLYSDNKLMTADMIGTDPRLTQRTRKGTGSYRVPGLKGLWYREPQEHGGSVATLEAWFDPVRQKEGRQIPPVKGHLFGLKLSFEEKQALFEFLSTL